MPFREYLEQVRPTINQRIEEVAGDGGAIDPGVLPLLLKGKRMRAGLLLRVHTALTRMTVPAPRALDLACALEFAHAASLILDDMLDGDAVRRGAPAHHLTRGEGRAVLDVVGILALPYALAAPYGSQYVTMLASAQQSMTRGVAWEVLEQPLLPSVELYDAVITRKTGCLFSLAAAWGAMTAGADEDVVTAFANFGLSAGKAMQIADDIADLHAPGDCRPGPKRSSSRASPRETTGSGGRWHRCLMRRSPVRRPGSGCSLPGSRGSSGRRSGISWGSRSPAPASINTVPPQTLPEKRYRP